MDYLARKDLAFLPGVNDDGAIILIRLMRVVFKVLLIDNGDM